jgi:pSer/pThr/pTyr-binding forkhead associated (FHA) protein
MNQALATPRAATAGELKAHIDAERQGFPFLVLRDGTGRHTILSLEGREEPVAIGRSPSAGVALSWDHEVSRIHAELEAIGEEWILNDDGLSLNGSYVNGDAVHGRRRLHDGDTIRVGHTVLLFRHPSEADRRGSTTPSGDPQPEVMLSQAQRRVLIALCRPFKDSTAFVTPAPNEQIAAELFLSVDAVKKHLRALFEKFGVAELRQNEKRARLVERAFAGGTVSELDFIEDAPHAVGAGRRTR